MKKNILLTGSTTGLGYDIAKNVFNEKKYNLICVYKDENKL